MLITGSAFKTHNQKNCFDYWERLPNSEIFFSKTSVKKYLISQLCLAFVKPSQRTTLSALDFLDCQADLMRPMREKR